MNAPNQIIRSLIVSALIAIPAAWSADQPAAGENLIVNGGFEEVKEVDATTGYFLSAIKAGVRLADDENALLVRIPDKILDQFLSPKKFIIVEGQPGKEVHSGKYSLLLSGGGFYLSPMIKVKPGEVYEFTCWAKGDAKVGIHFNLLDDQQKYFADAGGIPSSVPAGTNDWVEVKQRIEVRTEGARSAHMRFHAAESNEVTVDDFVLRKVAGE